MIDGGNGLTSCLLLFAQKQAYHESGPIAL
jgi:hypothetical protein